MKNFKVYLSFMKSFLKSGVKLNLSIFLIGVAAVMSFISIISCLKSSVTETAVTEQPYYTIGFDRKMTDTEADFFMNELPEIIWGRMIPSSLRYYSRDGKHICEETYYPVFPKTWEEVFVYFNSPHMIYGGRDLTEEELTADKGVIIASRDSLLDVGEKVYLPASGSERLALTVVGISDKFLVPVSFINENLGRFAYNTENLSIEPYRLEAAFSRGLTETEANALYLRFPNISFYINETPLDVQILIYVISVAAMAITAIFTVLQIYTMFLYLVSKVSYQTAVAEVCGCKSGRVTVIIMLCVLTYILADFAAGAMLMPLFINVMQLCRLNYIPGFADLLPAFAVFAAVASVAVLPGIKRISEAPLAKGVR